MAYFDSSDSDSDYESDDDYNYHDQGTRSHSNDPMILDNEEFNEPEPYIRQQIQDNIMERFKTLVLGKSAEKKPRKNRLSTISSDEMSEGSSHRNRTKKKSSVQYNQSTKPWTRFLLFLCSVLEFLMRIGKNLLVNCFYLFLGILYTFTGQDSFLKAIVKVPSAIFQGLSRFAGLNECSSTNTKNSLTLSLSRSTTTRNDAPIITACNWPLCVLVLTICGIFIAGCYSTETNSSIGTKYTEGVANLKYVLQLIMDDVYYIPGRTCMDKNNCCDGLQAKVVRWIKCIAEYPFRIAQNSWARSSSDMAYQKMQHTIDTISDWRMKRNLVRMKDSIQTLDKMVKMIRTKIKKFHTMNNMMDDISKQVSSNFEPLKLAFEKDEDKLYDTVGIYDEMMIMVRFLSEIYQRFKKVKLETDKNIKTNYKETIKETEKIEKDATKFWSKILPKAKALKQRCIENHENDADIHAESYLRKFLEAAACEANQNSVALGIVESVQLEMKNDFEQAHKFIAERVKLIKETMADKDQKMKETFDMNLRNYKTRLKYFEHERKYLSKSKLKNWSKQKAAAIHKESLLNFCKAMKETVKLTVFATMSKGDYKKCSMINTDIIKNLEEMASDIHELVKNHFPNCCYSNITNSTLFKQLEIFFNMWEFNSVIPWQIKLKKYFGIHKEIYMLDYASYDNGGRVVEESQISNTNLETEDKNKNSVKVSPDSSVHNILSSNLVFGNCWRFYKLNSFATVKLPNQTNVTHIGIEHIPSSISLDGNNSEAPKHFEIFAFTNEEPIQTISIEDFIYDNTAEELQIFKLKNFIMTNQIRILIRSNHGADFTCLYRFRIFSNTQ